MRPSPATRWLVTVLAIGACDRAAPPEPAAAAREPGPSQAAAPDARLSSAADRSAAGLNARPGAGGDVAPVANMPPGTACPPYYFVNTINYATNPSFEVGPGFAAWPPGPMNSAATGWFMHTSNGGAPITTQLVPTTAPAPAGGRMIAIRAGGNEGGIYQTVATPAKVMFSAWVFVNRGHVVIGTHAMVNQGPYAWSTKIGEWEQLRVCTDGSYPPGWFFVENEDPAGGSFYVDKVEIRAIP
jgi:hypothetical protein